RQNPGSAAVRRRAAGVRSLRPPSGVIYTLEAKPARLRFSGKNGRTRAIALPAKLWWELVGQRGEAGAEKPVFPSRSGKRLDRGRVRIIVRQAAERAGGADRVSPHWLRHAHPTDALERGAPIHLVQATLGHTSVPTTSRYLHARPG